MSAEERGAATDTRTARGTEALVVAGHGSHLNPSSDVPVYAHADEIRGRGVFDEVSVAFWKEEPSFRSVTRGLDSDTVYVVPMFMANGYFVDTVLPRELDDSVRIAEPVGTHPSMADTLRDRAVSLVEGEEGTAVAVVGHGTDLNRNSGDSAYSHVERLRQGGGFEEVKALFMDESPYVDDLTDHFETECIAVVPFFSSDGYHTQEDIPCDIGITDTPGEYEVPTEVDGHRVYYSGAVGTETRMADVILERASEAGADVSRDAAKGGEP